MARPHPSRRRFAPPQDEASKDASGALVGPIPVFSCFSADTDLGFIRDRRPNVRKSGKPDLRGPFQSVAVPDQRCTASRRTASGTRVIDCRIAFPSHQLNQSTLPCSRARISASGLCLFASLTPVEGWAERRETFGCSAEHPWDTP